MTAFAEDATPSLPAFIRSTSAALDDLKRFLTNALAGMELMRTAVPLLEMLDSAHSADKGNAVSEYVRFATEQLTTDAPYLHGLATIRLVTILESVVAEACVEALTRLPSALETEAVRKLEGPLVAFVAASPAERAEHLVDRLTEGTRAKLKSGLGRFEAILDCIGLGGGVHEAVRRTIFEMLEVRNVLTHRNGRVDQRLVTNCKRLNVAQNEVLSVRGEMFDRYLAAMQYYVVEITDRWFAASGELPRAPETTKLYKEQYVQRILELERNSSSG